MNRITPDDWPLVGLIPLFSLAGLYFHAERQRLAAGLAIEARAACFRLALIHFGLSAVLPARLVEWVKPFYLQAVCGVALPLGAASVVITQLHDAGALLCFVGLAADLSGRWLTGSTTVLAGLLLPKICMQGARMLMRLATIAHTERWLSFIRIQRWLESTCTARAQDAWMTLYSLLQWATGACTVLTVLQLRHSSLDIAHGLTVYASIGLGTAISILPAALGTFEAGAVAALIHADIDPKDALQTTLLLRIALYLPQLSLGLLFLAQGKIKWQALRGYLYTRRTP